MSFSQARRRSAFIIDERFTGRSLEVYTLDGSKFHGLVDEVSVNEIGMYVENVAVIIPRRAIAAIITGQSDIHGYGECCEKDFVLDERLIGSDVAIKSLSGQEIEGRLVKVTRNEIALIQGNRAYIFPRDAVLYVKMLRRP